MLWRQKAFSVTVAPHAWLRPPDPDLCAPPPGCRSLLSILYSLSSFLVLLQSLRDRLSLADFWEEAGSWFPELCPHSAKPESGEGRHREEAKESGEIAEEQPRQTQAQRPRLGETGALLCRSGARWWVRAGVGREGERARRRHFCVFPRRLRGNLACLIKSVRAGVEVRMPQADPMWDEEAQQQTRTNFERYPELLEGEDEVDWLNFQALNPLLVAMIDMCGSALRNKKDKALLKDWLSTVARDIKASREKEDCTCGRNADESMGCTCGEVAKPNERERALAQLTLLQILGALDYEVGLMLSFDRNFQALFCTQPGGRMEEQLANVLYNLDESNDVHGPGLDKGQLGTKDGPGGQPSIFSHAAFKVPVKVEYKVKDNNRNRADHALRETKVTIDVAGQYGEKTLDLDVLAEQIMNKIQEAMQAEEEEEGDSNFELVKGSNDLWLKQKKGQFVKVKNITHLRALLVKIISNSWTTGASVSKLKPASKRPFASLSYGPDPSSASTPATAGKRKKTPAKDAESDRDSDEDSEETDEDDKDASLFTQYKGNAATLQERLNHIGHLKQEAAKIEAMRWMINRVPPQGLTHSEWHFCAAAWEKACAQTAGRPDLCKVLKHAVQSDRSCPGLFRIKFNKEMNPGGAARNGGAASANGGHAGSGSVSCTVQSTGPQIQDTLSRLLQVKQIVETDTSGDLSESAKKAAVGQLGVWAPKVSSDPQVAASVGAAFGTIAQGSSADDALNACTNACFLTGCDVPSPITRAQNRNQGI